MDNAYLNGPQGSMLNIGSWFQADQPPDYGAHDLQTQVYNQNAMVDGGQFSYEFAGVRRMSFPLLVASGGAGLSLDSIEAWLRTLARPGAFIDLQPDGVATAEMVRFDVLGGRVNHDAWSLPLQRIDRRKLTLALDVQPWGYWPTWITLASVSGQAAPFRSVIPAASVIGDLPAFAKLMIQASSPALPSGPAGSYHADFVAWSIGGGGSMPPSAIFSGASWIADGAGGFTYNSDAFASQISGGPTVVRLVYGNVGFASNALFGLGGNTPDLRFPLANMDRIKGRHRVYLFARLGSPSAPQPWQVMLDAYTGPRTQPMASAAPIATIVPAGGSWGVAGYTPFGPAASPAYSMYDLGEITLPRAAVASGFESTASGGLRLWIRQASSAAATSFFDVAGVLLFPIDGPNGLMPRGMHQPTISQGISAGAAQSFPRLDLDASRRSAALKFQSATLDPDGVAPAVDGMAYYRGQFPMLGASDQTLTVVVGNRITNASTADPMIHATKGHVADWSLAYRPRFAFLKGL